MWPTRPLIDRIDGKAGRLRAHVAKRDINILLSGFFADDIEGFEGHLFRAFDSRARRCSEPQSYLTGIDSREDVRAKPATDKSQDYQNNYRIGSQRWPSETRDSLQPVSIALTDPVE